MLHTYWQVRLTGYLWWRNILSRLRQFCFCDCASFMLLMSVYLAGFSWYCSKLQGLCEDQASRYQRHDPAESRTAHERRSREMMRSFLHWEVNSFFLDCVICAGHDARHSARISGGTFPTHFEAYLTTSPETSGLVPNHHKTSFVIQWPLAYPSRKVSWLAST